MITKEQLIGIINNKKVSNALISSLEEAGVLNTYLNRVTKKYVRRILGTTGNYPSLIGGAYIWNSNEREADRLFISKLNHLKQPKIIKYNKGLTKWNYQIN